MIDTTTSSERFGCIYKRIKITDIKSLPLNICTTYNINNENRRVRNLLGNGYKYNQVRTDLDAYGNHY